jgi:carotenoid 1,2-hydratase
MQETVNPPRIEAPGPPAFDLAVPDRGYRWWYLDAVSHDGQHALVIIAFVGSVFSPYYYRARQRGPGAAEEHCAMNVALYGPGSRWAMTERDAGAISRSADTFVVGPSQVHWDGNRLVYTLRERCTPWGQAIRGQVIARPRAPCGLALTLDPGGCHQWRPWSPLADVEVRLDSPSLHWRGTAYLDANAGGEPLEAAFSTWDWSRTAGRGSDQVLHYEVRYPDGSERLFCFRVAADGTFEEAEPFPARTQRLTGWRVRRGVRSGHEIAEDRRLEDTPFYARSLFPGSSEAVHTVHETLDMNRFVSPWVRRLLPFRMPRRRS